MRLLCPWNSPGKNTGVDYHFLLPGGLPDPGFEPMSPAWQADSLPMSHQGSPRDSGISEKKKKKFMKYGACFQRAYWVKQRKTAQEFDKYFHSDMKNILQSHTDLS